MSLNSTSQAGRADAGASAMSRKMISLANAAMAGAVMANMATNRRPHAVERRWSAIELVTPLRTSRLGSAAVPSARQRNSVTKSIGARMPNGCRNGLTVGNGAAPGKAAASSPGRTGVSPAVISAFCKAVKVSP